MIILKFIRTVMDLTKPIIIIINNNNIIITSEWGIIIKSFVCMVQVIISYSCTCSWLNCLCVYNNM